MFKCSAVFERLTLLAKASKALVRLASSDYAFGKRATDDETCEAGNQCTICQVRAYSSACTLSKLITSLYCRLLVCSHYPAMAQEAMRHAVKLDCKHLFCQDCISEWFERSNQCPICRAVVKPPGLSQFGDGGTALLPQVF